MSCLFDSLSSFTPGLTSQSLRDNICDFLEENPTINGLTAQEIVQKSNRNNSLLEYVAQMRKPTTWGGAVEIKAFCDLRNTPVTVIAEKSGRRIEFIPESTKHPVVFITWNGNHFTPGYAKNSQVSHLPSAANRPVMSRPAIPTRVPTVAQRTQQHAARYQYQRQHNENFATTIIRALGFK